MRVYAKALEWKGAGLPWAELLIRQWVDAKDEAVIQLMGDDSFKSEEDRARAFQARGLGSRSTYFERKKHLKSPPSAPVPRIILKNSQPPKPAELGDWDIIQDFRNGGGIMGEG